MKAVALIVSIALGFGPLASAVEDVVRVAQFYKIDKVKMPMGVEPQLGAVSALSRGRIGVAFHQGEIGVYDPKTGAWQIFAEGLHEPLGLLEEKDGSLLVMQRPELTRLRDTNGDGVADQYETLWADFGMTGNYHEFAFGPALGPDGKLYVGLNLASNGATISKEIRGEWSPIGLLRADFYGDWKKAASKAGRMYSRAAWRGWIMQIDPATGVGAPFACGVRSPDGLGFDTHGNLLVSDNQGDWRGTSELFVVKRDGFYGHPASLVWQKGWDGTDPLNVPIPRLQALRTPPAIWFPHNIYANSPTQPVVIPKTPAWGAFGGQILIGEMNSPRLLRLLLEEVEGVWQGACINLIDTRTLKSGLHRLAFSGDTLWIGRTHLSWAGSEGLGTLTPTGKLPFDPLNIHVTPTGFRVDFTEPLAPESAQLSAWSIEHYSYLYHAAYGSPQVEKAVDIPTKITLSNNGRTAEIELEALRPGFIYDLHLERIQSVSGETLLNPNLAYTLQKVPK